VNLLSAPKTTTILEKKDKLGLKQTRKMKIKRSPTYLELPYKSILTLILIETS
jgi:hypothetical protein